MMFGKRRTNYSKNTIKNIISRLMFARRKRTQSAKKFYSPQQNGLNQKWEGARWCNPPYGRKIGEWIKKAAESEATVVMLLPARTDTKWFHDYCLKFGKIEFLKGRLKFGDAKENAPFPSMVVVFGEKDED